MKKIVGCLLAVLGAFGLQAVTVTRNIGSGTWDFNSTAFNSGGTLWTSNEDTAQFNYGSGGTVAVSSGVGARGLLLSSGTWTFSGLDPFTFGPDGITYVGGLATFNLPFQYSGSASLPIVGNNNGGTLTFGKTIGASAVSIAKPSGLVLKFDYSTTDAAKFQSGATISSVGNSTAQFFGGTSGETFGTLSAGTGTLTAHHWTNNAGLIQIGTIQRTDILGSVHLVDEFALATARPFRISGMQNTNGFIAPWVTVCFGPPAWSPRFAKIQADGTVDKILSSTKRLTQWVSGLNAVIDAQGLESAYTVPVCSVNSLALSSYGPGQNGKLNLLGSDITIESGGLLKTDGTPVMSNGTLRAGSEGRFYIHAFTTFDTENFFGPNAAGVLPEIVKFQSNNLLLKNPTNQFSGFSVMGGSVYLNGSRTPQAIGPVYMNPSTLFWVTNSAPVFGTVTVGQNAKMGLTNCATATFGSVDMGVNTDLWIYGTPKMTLSGFSGIGFLNAVNLGSTFELAFSGPAVVTNANINITAPSGITIRTVGNTWMAGINGLNAAVPITLTGPANSTNGIANLTLGSSFAGRTLTFTSGCWPFSVFSGTANGTVVIQDGARVVLTNGQTLLCGGQMTIGNGGTLVSEFGTFGWGAQTCVPMTNVLAIQDGGLLNLRSSRYHCWRFCGEPGNNGKVMIVNQTGGKVMVGVEDGSDPATSPAKNRNLIFGFGQNNNPVFAEAVYNLSGGEMQVAAAIEADSRGYSTNRFEFTGGILSPRQINSTNMTSIAVGLEPHVFVNRGGRLSPGGDDMAGLTEIYGNYRVLSANAEHLFTLGGSTQANGFQNTGAYSDYLRIRQAGIAQFAGKLLVKVVNNYIPPSTQTFTLIGTTENAVLSGSFDGFANGTGTVYSTDGAYRFTGVLTATSLTLSNARPNEWAAGDSADWTSGWLGDQVPGIGNTMNAVFGMSATNNALVTLDVAATPGLLLFDNSLYSYTIGGSGSLAASSIMIRSGSHTVAVPVSQSTPLVVTVSNTVSQAGLYAGRVETLSGTSYLLGTNPRWAVECYDAYSKALYIRYPSSAASDGLWVDNSTRVYSGWVYNAEPTNVVWAFAKKFDDQGSIAVNGVTLTFNTPFNVLDVKTATLVPGWNAFELRGYQGLGDAGAMDGWGFVYDPLGRATINRVDYQEFVETGDGSFFRTENAPLGTVVVRSVLTITAPITASALTVNGGGELKAASITADAVTVAAGTRLSISDTVQTSALTMEEGAVLNFVSPAARLILLGADIDAAQAFILAGKFAAFGSVTDKPAAFGIALVEGGVRVRPLNLGTQIILK